MNAVLERAKIAAEYDFDLSLEGKTGSGAVKTGLVSVVIPNWNGKKFLAGCLDSLLTQTYPQVEIVVVDNGSHDGSVDYLKANYPQVKLICFPVNTGFSPAVNAGIRASLGEYIALVNNDTVSEATWLEELVNAIKANPD